MDIFPSLRCNNQNEIGHARTTGEPAVRAWPGLTVTTSAARPERNEELFLLLRADDHDHLAAFQLRELLDLAIRLEVAAQAFQHAHTDILVGHFAAAEAQRDLGLVAFFEELH